MKYLDFCSLTKYDGDKYFILSTLTTLRFLVVGSCHLAAFFTSPVYLTGSVPFLMRNSSSGNSGGKPSKPATDDLIRVLEDVLVFWIQHMI
jgi:K+-transporting ATPase c subunit